MAQFLAAKNRRLISANVGSMGGLVALSRSECHLAGSHLLDPESGEYNIYYVKRLLPDSNVRIITLSGRQQGLLVAKGNPKGIYSLEDLIKPDVTYINRQSGAGTRVLLDYQLKRLKINCEVIQGYYNDEFTHLGVAAAIVSGRADCGLGIAAAAQALGLDFIPLYQERYDLVIPQSYYESRLLEPFFDLLTKKEFKETVADLPGYDISDMGKIVL
jgi:putative molybdopterin biosynthesis protein